MVDMGNDRKISDLCRISHKNSQKGEKGMVKSAVKSIGNGL
jgi:hypothetical protein